MKIPLARNLMVTSLVTLKPQMHIHDAIKLLLKKKISGAPVIDKGRRLVGVISEKDCLKIFASGAYNLLPGSMVEDYMSKNLTSIPPDMELFKIADMFLTKPYRRLPVVENEILLGQVSRRDVLAGSRKIWETTQGETRRAESNFLTDEIKAALK